MSEQLPIFNNGITPSKLVVTPVLDAPVPRRPVEELEDYVIPANTVLNLAPVEAVPGVGGIPGVQAEE